jgi:hypothetical protein
MKAVCNQQRHGKPTWSDIARYLKVQREYVPLYVQHLRRQDAEKGKDAGKHLPRIVELDRDLPKDVTLHFRKLAHAQVRLKNKEGVRKKEDKPPPRTWVGWLGFGGGRHVRDAAAEGADGQGAVPGDSSPDRQDKGERAFLTDNEVQALEDIVQAQVPHLCFHCWVLVCAFSHYVTVHDGRIKFITRFCVPTAEAVSGTPSPCSSEEGWRLLLPTCASCAAGVGHREL